MATCSIRKNSRSMHRLLFVLRNIFTFLLNVGRSRGRTFCCATIRPASIAERQYPPSELTLDHVLPRSRGGESAWDNLVACCKRCNHRKGNRTPEESGMHLLRRPRGFSLHVNRQIMRYLGRADETWRKYLFYESDSRD